MRDLGTLGVDNSSPSFISDTGDIIGVADLTSSRHQNPHAILLRNRKRNVEKSDLGALKGDSYSRACRVIRAVRSSETRSVKDSAGSGIQFRHRLQQQS